MVKRSFDIAISATLLLFALPILVLAALLIRFTSPGPVLFRQTRMGRGRFVTWVTTYTVEPDEVVGRQTFRILKFDPSGAAA